MDESNAGNLSDPSPSNASGRMDGPADKHSQLTADAGVTDAGVTHGARPGGILVGMLCLALGTLACAKIWAGSLLQTMADDVAHAAEPGLRSCRRRLGVHAPRIHAVACVCCCRPLPRAGEWLAIVSWETYTHIHNDWNLHQDNSSASPLRRGAGRQWQATPAYSPPRCEEDGTTTDEQTKGYQGRGRVQTASSHHHHGHLGDLAALGFLHAGAVGADVDRPGPGACAHSLHPPLHPHPRAVVYVQQPTDSGRQTAGNRQWASDSGHAIRQGQLS